MFKRGLHFVGLLLAMFVQQVLFLVLVDYLSEHHEHSFDSKGSFYTTLPFFAQSIIKILILPVLEELGFRLPLVPITFSLKLVSLFSIFLLALGAFMLYSEYELSFYLILSSFVIFFFPNTKSIGKNTKALIISFSFLFGLGHVFSYTGEVNFPIALCIFTTHFINGLIYSYIRVGFGICTSILLHSTFNSIPVIFTLIIHR